MSCCRSVVTKLMLLALTSSLVSGADEVCKKYKDWKPTHSNCQEPHPEAILLPLSDAKKQEIVKLHNDYRRRVSPPAANMMKMHWDETLATSAKNHIMRCTGDHDDITDRGEREWANVKIGQNLGMGHQNFGAMLERMWTEKDRYNYTYGPGYNTGAGHFYQIITDEVTRVGCAEVKCPYNNGKVVWRICNYAPALNADIVPYRKGKWCEECPGRCDNNLCDCGMVICMNGGVLDPATCKCKCKGMWTGDACETLDCKQNEPENCKWNQVGACGISGFVKDPKMCPHLCGVCQECQGKTCQNGGTMDYATCTCQCSDNYIGDFCETRGCPVRDAPECSTMLPRENCTESSPNRPAPTFSMCPIFCQSCKTTCKFCENYGDLVTKPDCKCECKGGFRGNACEICPETEEAICDEIPLEWCEDVSMMPYFHVNCPYRCGVCKR